MSQKLTIVLLTLTLLKLMEQLVQVVMCTNILVKINRELKEGSISLEQEGIRPPGRNVLMISDFYCGGFSIDLTDSGFVLE